MNNPGNPYSQILGGRFHPMNLERIQKNIVKQVISEDSPPKFGGKSSPSRFGGYGLVNKGLKL